MICKNSLIKRPLATKVANITNMKVGIDVDYQFSYNNDGELISQFD